MYICNVISLISLCIYGTPFCKLWRPSQNLAPKFALRISSRFGRRWRTIPWKPPGQLGRTWGGLTCTIWGEFFQRGWFQNGCIHRAERPKMRTKKEAVPQLSFSCWVLAVFAGKQMVERITIFGPTCQNDCQKVVSQPLITTNCFPNAEWLICMGGYTLQPTR